jgi:hypothetical protein
MKAAAVLAALALASVALHAQSNGRGPAGQLLYPAKGQSAQQTDRDRYECHDWARQQSGFDPSQPTAAAMPPTGAALPASAAPTSMSAQSTKSATGSIVAGAAGGAAIAELTEQDTGKGAAVGVLGAGLRQQMKQSQQAAAKQQQQQQQSVAQQQAMQQAMQQQAALASQRAVYDRGFAACMEARGYVVK